MPLNEVKTEFQGHQIAVHNAWGYAWDFKSVSYETKLYIDGDVVDTYAQRIGMSAKVPLLRGEIKENDKTHIVEVYATYGFRFKAKICVDGKKIVGNLE